MSWYPDLPHDQAGGDGGPRTWTQMVVIHATDNTASAAAEARYAETRPDHTSAHFYSDETQVTQALDTSHIAYGCFPTGNSRSVQFEISGLSNQLSDASLRTVAPVVARACKEFDIPIRKVSSLDLVNGVRGICGHLDVTYAWGEGDHTDPGASFPWGQFIGYVQAALDPPPEEEEMARLFEKALEPGVNVCTPITTPPIQSSGVISYGRGFLSICNDVNAPGAPGSRTNYKLRVFWTSGGGVWARMPGTADDGTVVVRSGAQWVPELPASCRSVSIQRIPVDASDTCEYPLSVVVDVQ